MRLGAKRTAGKRGAEGDVGEMQYLRGERSFTFGRPVRRKGRPHTKTPNCMSNVLILGGTRNLGYFTAVALMEAGHTVSVMNRGVTRDDLPPEVERIRGTRGDTPAMHASLGHRDFDMIVDMTTYTASEAKEAVEIFDGHTARHVFISSGQVYLVREDLPRPFREVDYNGPVMKAPAGASDYESWKYGIDKREAEAVFDTAFRERKFPVTTLRLPMVASERDHYGRIQGYFARILDGGPILIPDETGLPIRHVYADDVARFIVNLARSNAGIGTAVNVSYGQSLSLTDYLSLLGDICGGKVKVVKAPREVLEKEELLPDCSPFSGTWMSELDNQLSLGMFGSMVEYTPPDAYLGSMFENYKSAWIVTGEVPAGYSQRPREFRMFGDGPISAGA
jgi:nucleoside-diphosphate-sugar epimerase